MKFDLLFSKKHWQNIIIKFEIKVYIYCQIYEYFLNDDLPISKLNNMTFIDLPKNVSEDPFSLASVQISLARIQTIDLNKYSDSSKKTLYRAITILPLGRPIYH